MGRKRNTRSAKKSILVVTNGAVTEQEYLHVLKRLVKKRDTKINIKVINGAPLSLLPGRKYQRQDHDEVWIVVDEDDHTEQTLLKFLKQCERHRCVGIISRPCFEVWLVAHYGQVKRYADQDEVQNHLAELSGNASKHLAEDFPYSAVEDALERCILKGESLSSLSELPPTPGTAMPHLVRAFGILNG